MTRLVVADGSEIAIVDPRTRKTVTRLPPHTSGRLANRQPVWSPDGKRIAWSAYDRRRSDAPTVVSVVEAVDGPLSLTQCFTDDGACEQFDTCSVKSPLQRLNDRVLQMLGHVTIAQICEEDFESLTAGVGEIRLPVIQESSRRT